MSTTTQTLQAPRRRVTAPAAVAAGLALTIGVVSGSVITRAAVERDVRLVPVAAATWDAQKVEAMQGRVLYAEITSAPSVQLWDPDKVAAMEGRQLAEQLHG
jgi:hypothetical protein